MPNILIARNWSLRAKLSLSLAVVLLAMTAAVLVSLVAGIRTGAQITTIVEVNNGRARLATSLLQEIDTITNRTTGVMLSTKLSDVEVEMKLLKAAISRYVELEERLIQWSDDPSATAEAIQVITRVSEGSAAALPLVQVAAKAGEDGDSVKAVEIFNTQVRPSEVAWRSAVESLVRMQDANNRELSSMVLADQRIAVGTTFSILVLTLIASAVLCVRLTRSITGPIDETVALAESIAQGDLTAGLAVKSGDELGRLQRAVLAMQSKLSELVSQIKTSAESIEGACDEVAQGNHDLSHRTELAAVNLEHAAASMVQLSGAIMQSAESATQANRIAVKTSEVAREGSGDVRDVVIRMQKVHEGSRRIAEITSTIDSIAFQTNVLALNAAVEAARAGVQGRGFAVVAQEVRALATRAAEAAKEIGSLIGSSVSQIEDVNTLALQAGRGMELIVSSVNEVDEVIRVMAKAADEQRSDIGGISTNVQSLEGMTQQNAALVEQSAAAAQSLREQAKQLTAAIGNFKLA